MSLSWPALVLALSLLGIASVARAQDAEERSMYDLRTTGLPTLTPPPEPPASHATPAQTPPEAAARGTPSPSTAVAPSSPPTPAQSPRRYETPPNATLVAGLTTASVGAVGIALGLGFLAVSRPVLITTITMDGGTSASSSSALLGLQPVIVGAVLGIIGITTFVVGAVLAIVGWLCPPRRALVALGPGPGQLGLSALATF